MSKMGKWKNLKLAYKDYHMLAWSIETIQQDDLQTDVE